MRLRLMLLGRVIPAIALPMKHQTNPKRMVNKMKATYRTNHETYLVNFYFGEHLQEMTTARINDNKHYSETHNEDYEYDVLEIAEYLQDLFENLIQDERFKSLINELDLYAIDWVLLADAYNN